MDLNEGMHVVDSWPIEELIEEITSCINSEFEHGFPPIASLVDHTLEFVADRGDVETLRPYAVHALNAAIEKQRQLESTWPEVTDCDRLDAAFDSLERRGVLCRQNYLCCINCAHKALKEEIRIERDKGRKVFGGAHYNVQNTEHAIEGHGLYISFLSTRRTDAATAMIGRRIANALAAQGLDVTWDGDPGFCVQVKLDWKRRIPLPRGA